jgi:MFS family permease
MKKSFGLITLGAILEYYDFAIYIYFAKTIGENLIPIHDAQANLIATFGVLAIGALFRPLGGMLIAHFGDRKGRKNVFIYTILLMAIPTALIAFIPSYTQIGIYATVLLIVLRCIQGLAIGGEIPGSIVFAYELSQTKNKALNTNIVVAGTNLGFFLASAIGAWLLSLSIANNYAWRIAFIVGGVFGIISYFLRKSLSETPEFANYRNFIDAKAQLPSLELLKNYSTPLVQMIAYGGFVAASLAVYSFFMPAYLNQYFHFPLNEILKYNSYSLLIFIVSAFTAGKWHYFFGKKFLVISLITFNLINFILFTHYQLLNLATIVLIHYFIWFYIGIICGRLPVLAASFFPVQVRYSGVALSYNIALGIIAGFTQVILFSLIKTSGILWLPALYIGVLSIPALIFLVKIPATKLINYN